MEEILTYLPTLLSIFFLYFRLMNIHMSKRSLITVTISIILITVISIYLQNFNPVYSHIIFIFLTCVSLTIIKKHLLPISLITIGYAYCIKLFSFIFVTIIAVLLNYNNADIVLGIPIVLLQLLSTVFFTKIKRLRYAFIYFNKLDNLGIGLLISGFIVVFACTINQYQALTTDISKIMVIGVLISSIGLFLWIRKSITEHYRKKLQQKADEHYQNTLLEKEQQIEQLNNSNSFLSKIVHRDNHIMTSLQHTITKYKDCDNPIEREKLLNEILTLAQERSDLIVKEQANTKVLPTTGISLIDGALSNMYIKATAHHIDFNLIINQDIHYLVNNLITQTDLETLLCDHIKDAIIAINSGEVIKGKILVTITMNDDIYEISIKDNGVDFEVDTLAKLGLERVTTHKDIGGSGIGFMTTFETLKRSNASIIITEHKTKTPFSKSITFRFDGLNAFIINSYRADLLKQSINRNDIVIM